VYKAQIAVLGKMRGEMPLAHRRWEMQGSGLFGIYGGFWILNRCIFR